MPPVTVIACGEPMRGDDGVAFAVADALPVPTRSLVVIRRVRSLLPDDLLSAHGPLVILDAVAGPAAGTIIELPLAAVAADASSVPAARSSHALPLSAMLGIVAALRDGGLPPGRFLGVAVGRVGVGDELSPAVAAAVPRAASRVAACVRLLGRGLAVTACA